MRESPNIRGTLYPAALPQIVLEWVRAGVKEL